MDAPKTLQQAIQYFSDFENCRAFMVAVRWPDGVVKCPKCGSEKVTWLETAKVYRCYGKHPKVKFSLKVGTVFEDSPIGLEKWLPAAWLLSNSRNGISSYELHRSLGVTQKSAWFMLHRIRTAMKDTNWGSKIGGNDPGHAGTEVDEAFVGGAVANMHKAKLKAMRANAPAVIEEGYEKPRYDNKAIVLGIFDRESRQVRTKVIPNTKRETLQAEILKNIKYGSKVYTDEAVGYDLLRRRYVHDTVNHAEAYVKGNVHTNSLENFWSLTKRTLTGTYVAVEPFHLDRYLDEQMFRFNNRVGKTDFDRFRRVVSQLAGRRLTYADLTGKVGETAF
jgi:transposase-like protein